MKRLCIYLTYDKQNIVYDYVGYMLKELKKNVTTLVVVSNQLQIKDGKHILDKYADEVFYRDNIGFDADGFKDALCQYIGWDKLSEYDELVLMNDSFFGPCYDLEEYFACMETQDCDFWGITRHPGGIWGESSLVYSQHIQSYFVVFKKDILLSMEFMDFWKNLKYPNNFEEAVFQYEISLSNYLMSAYDIKNARKR